MGGPVLEAYLIPPPRRARAVPAPAEVHSNRHGTPRPLAAEPSLRSIASKSGNLSPDEGLRMAFGARCTSWGCELQDCCCCYSHGGWPTRNLDATRQTKGGVKGAVNVANEAWIRITGASSRSR